MINAAIYSLLTSSTDITDIVGTGIYPEIAPQGYDMPFIIYQIDEALPETSKDGPSKLDTYAINIIGFGNDYDELFVLAYAVRDTIDRYRGVIASTNIDQINYKGLEGDYDNMANVFKVHSEYNIRVKL